LFHDVQRPTDPLMALNEGLAEYFQAVDFVNQPPVRSMGRVLDARRSLKTARSYVSPRPRRMEVIAWNRALFEPALPNVEGPAPAERLQALYQNAQPFDNHRLRSCGEALSVEGVVAAVLLRMVLDPELQKTPFPQEILKRFAAPGVEPSAWLASLGPTAPVELKLIHVFSSIVSGSAVANLGLREVIETWLREFPSDARPLVRVFVTATLGVTRSASFAQRERSLLSTLKVVPSADPDREKIEALQGELSRLGQETTPDTLFSACGRPLWLSVQGREIMGDFGNETSPLQIDLNAAGTIDLATLPGFDLARAVALLAKRDEHGYFYNFDEFFTAAGLPPEPRARLSPTSP
jgi:hypothetical protein